MAHSDVTVYVTDLDGTILDGNARLSPRTCAGLEELLDEGLLLTVASARSVVAMQLMFDGLRLPLPVVEFNGAFISNLATREHLVTNAIGADVVGDVYRTITAAGCLPFVSTFDGDADRLYYSEILNDGTQLYLDNRVADHDPRVRHTDDLRPHLTEEVASLTVIDRVEPVKELRLKLEDEFGDRLSLVDFDSLYFTGWHWMTVHDARATKDQALLEMLRREGLDGAEVVAFGDSSGDLPLFRVADRAIAVANASDELMSMATEVTGANYEDGVVEFLERDWNGARSQRP
ncbi:MAG: HAD hydrolase family protein [Candidatus Eisenbacteria bacterium]